MPSVELASRHGYQVLVSVGLVSYGIVHLVLAWISAQVALGGGGGEDASSTGALKELGQQPFGLVLLWVMAVGLLALVLWQGLEVDRRQAGSRRQGPAEEPRPSGRAGRWSTWCSASPLPGWRPERARAGCGDAEETLTARLMSVPFGRVLVVAVGVAVLAVGISQIVKGVRQKFVEDDLAGGVAPWVVKLGTIGWVAKGVALGLIGRAVRLGRG